MPLNSYKNINKRHTLSHFEEAKVVLETDFFKNWLDKTSVLNFIFKKRVFPLG